MLRKMFFASVILGLVLNSILDYRVVMETSFPKIVAENSSVYHLLAIFDGCVLLLLSFMFWKQWSESRKIESRLRLSINDIRTMNRELQRNQSLRDEQFKLAIHDIKNPLGVIQGFAGLIKDEANDGASVAEMSRIVERVSGEALLLVQDLLTKSPGLSAAPDSEINLSAQLQNVCQDFAPVAKRKNQSLTLEKLPANLNLRVSLQDIKSVLQNLIGNAIKFTPKGGTIQVFAEKEVANIMIKVQDNGPGFSSSDLENLFQEGRVLSAKPSDGEHSSGVGMRAVKIILDHYGAVIEIAAAQPGAAITVRFPLEQRM